MGVHYDTTLVYGWCVGGNLGRFFDYFGIYRKENKNDKLMEKLRNIESGSNIEYEDSDIIVRFGDDIKRQYSLDNRQFYNDYNQILQNKLEELDLYIVPHYDEYCTEKYYLSYSDYRTKVLHPDNIKEPSEDVVKLITYIINKYTSPKIYALLQCTN